MGRSRLREAPAGHAISVPDRLDWGGDQRCRPPGRDDGCADLPVRDPGGVTPEALADLAREPTRAKIGILREAFAGLPACGFGDHQVPTTDRFARSVWDESNDAGVPTDELQRVGEMFVVPEPDAPACPADGGSCPPLCGALRQPREAPAGITGGLQVGCCLFVPGSYLFRTPHAAGSVASAGRQERRAGAAYEEALTIVTGLLLFVLAAAGGALVLVLVHQSVSLTGDVLSVLVYGVLGCAVTASIRYIYRHRPC
jgi:hypothetical protein